MTRLWVRLCVAILSAIALQSTAQLNDEQALGKNNYAGDDEPWKELDVSPPTYPSDTDLIEFDTGPTNRNRYLIDGSTISPGEDGVVRYVLVLRTPGGATNVSFEGIRCDTKEFKLYALGRMDRTWSSVKISAWQRIEYNEVLPYRAMLFRNFFCASGPINTSEEGRSALKRGRHSAAPY